jgi:hypothetical protein
LERGVGVLRDCLHGWIAALEGCKRNFVLDIDVLRDAPPTRAANSGKTSESTYSNTQMNLHVHKLSAELTITAVTFATSRIGPVAHLGYA